MAGEAWRTDADEAWPTHRRSSVMAWLRRRLGILRPVADAVSHADLGPYAGSPRRPNLRVDDEKTYSTVRYTTDRITYTTTSADPDECRRCGQPLTETHRIEYVQGEANRVTVGAARTCRGCQAGSWLLHSRMPAASRARTAARKHVL